MANTYAYRLVTYTVGANKTSSPRFDGVSRPAGYIVPETPGVGSDTIFFNLVNWYNQHFYARYLILESCHISSLVRLQSVGTRTSLQRSHDHNTALPLHWFDSCLEKEEKSET